MLMCLHAELVMFQLLARGEKTKVKKNEIFIFASYERDNLKLLCIHTFPNAFKVVEERNTHKLRKAVSFVSVLSVQKHTRTQNIYADEIK